MVYLLTAKKLAQRCNGCQKLRLRSQFEELRFMATTRTQREVREPMAQPRADSRWGSSSLPSGDDAEMVPYLVLLRRRWWRVALAATAAAFGTGVLTAFVFTKWYKAEALIRPVAQSAIQARLAGMVGGFGGGLGDVSGFLGFGESNDAEEYIAILKSFDFSVALVRRHHLEASLLKYEQGSGPKGFLSLVGIRSPSDRQWQIYRILEQRFDAFYSIRTGNITLSYIDDDRQRAQQILRFYVDDLRDLLRKRTIEDTSAAIKSMIAEADATPDTLLQARLYELIARQMQQRKLAEVEADFAFRVIDPPAASDKPYSPRVLFDSALAGLLAAVFYALVIWLRHVPQVRAHGMSQLPRAFAPADPVPLTDEAR